jgi:hypothetical protein
MNLSRGIFGMLEVYIEAYEENIQNFDVNNVSKFAYYIMLYHN